MYHEIAFFFFLARLEGFNGHIPILAVWWKEGEGTMSTFAIVVLICGNTHAWICLAAVYHTP